MANPKLGVLKNNALEWGALFRIFRYGSIKTFLI